MTTPKKLYDDVVINWRQTKEASVAAGIRVEKASHWIRAEFERRHPTGAYVLERINKAARGHRAIHQIFLWQIRVFEHWKAVPDDGCDVGETEGMSRMDKWSLLYTIRRKRIRFVRMNRVLRKAAA